MTQLAQTSPDGDDPSSIATRHHLQARTAGRRRRPPGRQVGEPPLTGHTSEVRAVACARLPDGRTVAVTSGDDQTMRVWDLATGRHVNIVDLLGTGRHVNIVDLRCWIWWIQPSLWRGHLVAVKAVACATLLDGRTVAATGGIDRTVRVWDLATGKQVGRPLTGHTGAVWAVACARLPDGRTVVVTGGADGTVRVWDIQNLLSEAPRPDDLMPVRLIDVDAPVLALDVQGETWLVATSSGVLALRPAFSSWVGG